MEHRRREWETILKNKGRESDAVVQSCSYKYRAGFTNNIIDVITKNKGTAKVSGACSCADEAPQPCTLYPKPSKK